MCLKIGNIALKGNLVLGPMAGVTDLPFRLLCKEMGADLIYTEMVSAKGILYENRNTEDLLAVEDVERPVSLQLFGSDPDILSTAAKKIEERNFDILDINMGCPVPKVVNNGEGSALMKNPELIGRLVKACVGRQKKPVTIKIRKGFTEADVNAPLIAKIAEENGASAIAVHARSREQYYSGKADWNVIRQVKEAVKIPVIGNGDVNTPQDVKRMIEVTGCDGIMIARAVRGNPWFFRQVKEYMASGTLLERPNFKEVSEVILRHCDLMLKYKGEVVGMREMRKHVAWYTSGFRGGAKLRNEVNLVETKEQLEDLLVKYTNIS